MATSVDSTTTTDPETGETTYTSTINLGNVHLYNNTGSGSEITTGVTKNGNPDGVGTFELTDTRGTDQTYLVRRLADGNCWMVQNLKLDLAEFVGKNPSNTTEDKDAVLSVANTDLNTVGVNYWDPGESMYELARSIDPSVSTSQSSYFPVASNDRIGYAQDYQFQPYGVSGGNYRWGSKYLDVDGVKTEQTSFINSAYSEMPRSYENALDWVDNSAPNTDSNRNANYHTSGTPNNASEYIGSL